MEGGEDNATRTPEFLWAQTQNQIYLTINVPNVKASDAQIKVQDDGSIYFRGVGGSVGDEHLYELDIKLLLPIKASGTQCNVGARSVQFKIPKVESGAYWDRLLKDKTKNVHCKVDWDHWRDEDEEDDYDFGSSWASKDMADLDFGDEKADDDDDDEDDKDDEDVDDNDDHIGA
mmetsp:Transcript_6703/g.20298  ORF Transcript_6703/g.20298 Transcript_6703/m.20298 type:complete len:174 (+) Transcript_6703:163-684(+)